jgi:hypothetical protein
MPRKIFIVILLALAPFALFSARVPYTPNLTEIRVVPVRPTPESETVKLEFIFPKSGEVEHSSKIKAQLKIKGFPLRTNSNFERANEIWTDPIGQHIHVVVDNYSYFAVKWETTESIDPKENYYTQVAEFSIPFTLDPGQHMIRAFPVRSFHESLKGRGAFASEMFYFQSNTPKLDQDLNGPYLTYNVPRDDRIYPAKEPLLLDFYISNVNLSNDGYKVEATIDGGNKRYLTLWTPYYIYGLKPGAHSIQLRLLDPQNNLVPGKFNDITQRITIR